jgi:hypothetical protein
VDEITCVGVPIGSPDFVSACVKAKTSAVVDDVRKLHVLSDPITHIRLIGFCHTQYPALLSQSELAPRCDGESDQAIAMR